MRILLILTSTNSMPLFLFKRSIWQHFRTVLSCFYSVVMFLALLFFSMVSIFLYYQSSLGNLENTSTFQKISYLLPTLSFYLGMLYWYMSFGTSFTKRSKLIKRTLFFLLVAATLFLNALLLMLFSKVGDNASIYIKYYFLTDFTHFKPIFFLFEFVLIVFFALLALLTARHIYQALKQKKRSQYVHITIVLSLLFLSFFSFSPNHPNSVSSNLLSYFLTSFHQSPSKKHFAAHTNASEQVTNITAASFQPNIAIIVLESTRRDAISAYNPDLAVKTEFFDELAQDSLVFYRAQSSIPHTSKALVSIHCGVFPYPNLPILESVHGLPSPCLPEQLALLGYENYFMQSATHYFENRQNLVEQFGFKQFFSAEDVDDDQYSKRYFGYDDEVVLKPNGDWLSTVKQPFIASYLTVGTHWPYEVDKEQKLHQYFEKKKHKGLRLFDLQKPFNNYLNLVNKQDDFLRQLIQQYKDSGHYDNTLFIILADHGEAFGEHQPLQHNNNMYPEVLDIPMLIHAPFAKHWHGESHQLIQQSDIALMLNNVLNGKELLQDIDHQALFSSCWYWRWCIARTDENYRYIHNFDDSPDELYAIANDPLMKINIASQHPERVQVYRQESLKWYQQQLAHYGQYFSQYDKHFYRVGSPGGTNLSSHQKNNKSKQ